MYLEFENGFNWKMFLLIMFFVAIFIVMGYRMAQVDTTDKSFLKRSGMHLYTDESTGIQYVGSPHGGLTPRIDKNGKLYSDRWNNESERFKGTN